MLFEAHLGVRQGEQGLLTSPVFMESSASCKSQDRLLLPHEGKEYGNSRALYCR